MRAVRKLKPGPDNIALCDIPEPGIENPDDIKIAVQRGGLCGTDLHIRHGGYGFRPPVTLCHELAGEVVEVGHEVSPASKLAIASPFYPPQAALVVNAVIVIK